MVGHSARHCGGCAGGAYAGAHHTPGAGPAMKWLLVLVIVASNTVGDLLNAIGMRRHGEVREFHPTALTRLVGLLARNGYVLGGIVCMAVGFFALIELLARADLSFAVPAT